VSLPEEAAARGRAWRHATHAAICDVIEPWAHGTLVRATRFPDLFSFNLVRVEDRPGVGVRELAASCEEALAGLGHRRIDFDRAEDAAPLRSGFVADGWSTMDLTWMRREPSSRDSDGDPAVGEVPYGAVHDLRVAWHREDAPDQPSDYLAQAREVAERRGARVLAVRDRDVAVGFVELERVGPGAEITAVYVLPDYRGRGLGSALVRAAGAAAGDVRDLWICADEEARPRGLYDRLGFRAVWRSTEFLRVHPS
jgi:ribosomal protein S18 acetylase RimI-like enzyme